jgi:O-antigen/teichoic acid export membrane protein
MLGFFVNSTTDLYRKIRAMNQGNFSKYIELAFHTVIHSLNWIAGMLAGLLLLPIYSKELSVAEYGALDLSQQLSGLVRSVFASAFTYSIAKFYHSAVSVKEKGEAIWTNAISLSTLGICLCGMFVLFNDSLTMTLYGRKEYASFAFLTTLSLAVDFCNMGFSSQFLVEKKSLIFVCLAVLRLLIAIALNLFFLLSLKLGGNGMLLGGLISSGIVTAVSIVICFNKFSFRFNPKLARDMFRAGYPMIPATCLALFLHQGDRFFLSHYKGLDSLGFFTMAVQFPSQLNALLLTSFNQVWINNYLHDSQVRTSSENYIAKSAAFFMAFYLGCQALLCVFIPLIFASLVDDKFQESLSQVPVVSLAFCVHAVYIFLTTSGFQTGKFLPLTLSYLVACCTKIGIYLFFRDSGVFLPSVSMLVSYAVFVTCCYVFYRRSNNNQVDLRIHLLQFLIFFAVVFGIGPQGSAELSLSNAIYLLCWSLVIPALMVLPLGLFLKMRPLRHG